MKSANNPQFCKTTVSKFSNGALDDLRTSGLTDDTISRNALHEIDDVEEVGKILGWNGPATGLGRCLAFPHYDLEGKPTGHVRLKSSNPRGNRETNAALKKFRNREHESREINPEQVAKCSSHEFVDSEPNADGVITTACRHCGKFLGSRTDVRPKVVKYEQPKGTVSEAFWHRDAGTFLRNSEQPLMITEGEKKALALFQHGFHASLSIPRVWNWQHGRRKLNGKPDGPRQLLDVFTQIPLEDRDVFIVFDSDATENAQVLAAEGEFAWYLRNQFGARVRTVRIPSGPNDEKQGADDFLVRNGTEAMRKLIVGAIRRDVLKVKRAAAEMRKATLECPSSSITAL